MKPAKAPIVRTLIAAAGFLLVSCSEKTHETTEAQIRASALLVGIFRGSQDNWFGAQTPIGSKKVRTFEFHHPTTTVIDRPVTDTDRMNGVTDRFRITLTADQFRFWDGHWSAWHQGTGSTGSAGLLNAMSGGLMGDWVTTIEKKNGEWHQHDMTGIQGFVQDKTLVDSMIRSAGE